MGVFQLHYHWALDWAQTSYGAPVLLLLLIGSFLFVKHVA
jgi:hypothetical protein